jgi:hypothetical protein
LELNERHVWAGVGLVILVFLVVTTPGWKEVLGFNFSFDMGKYAPALILLGVMGALLGFVLMGGKQGDD